MTLDFLSDDPATAITGLAAAICLTLAPSFRSRHSILVAQLCAGGCFCAHYLCLGIIVAAAANLLGLVQTTAAIFAVGSASMNRLGYVLIGLIVLSGLWFWQGPISGLSVLAMTLIALGRMQADVLRLRLLILSGGVFWVAHDLVVQAWFAFAADVGAIVIGSYALGAMFVRVRIEWRRRQEPTRSAIA